MVKVTRNFLQCTVLTTYHSKKELELVGDSQVIPRLCLLLYAILFEYNIHSNYVKRSSIEHVFNIAYREDSNCQGQVV